MCLTEQVFFTICFFVAFLNRALSYLNILLHGLLHFLSSVAYSYLRTFVLCLLSRFWDNIFAFVFFGIFPYQSWCSFLLVLGHREAFSSQVFRYLSNVFTIKEFGRSFSSSVGADPPLTVSIKVLSSFGFATTH